MRQLDPPEVDDAEWYQKITNAKQEPIKSRLLRAEPQVLNAYVDYVDKAPEVDTVSSVNFTGDQRNALLHAYNIRTKALSALRAEVMQPDSARRCPFCGIGESATLDHYLPQENYPQYAIFPKNLIPCCDPCNRRKSDRVQCEETQLRLFFHPYYDLIPDERFLTVAIELQPDAMEIKYELSQTDGVAQADFDRLSSHFNLLSLPDRYCLMSADELRGRYGVIESRYGQQRDAQGVRDLLALEAQSLASEYGSNHWRAVLYTALSEHDAFCDGGFSTIVA